LDDFQASAAIEHDLALAKVGAEPARLEGPEPRLTGDRAVACELPAL
jgi:hypothetical protein